MIRPGLRGQYRGIALTTTPTGVVDGEFVQTDDDEGRGYHDRPAYRIGQGYTFGPNPSELRGLLFRLVRVGTVGGLLNAVITDVSNNIVARSTTFYAAEEVDGASETNYFFALSGWTPTANATYHVFLELWDGFFDANNYIDLIVESGAEATAPDSTREYDYSAASAVALDTAFKVYSASGSAATPDDDGSIRFRGAFNRRRYGWGA